MELWSKNRIDWTNIFVFLKKLGLLLFYWDILYNTVPLILNPQCSADVMKIGMFLKEIEKNMETHKLC